MPDLSDRPTRSLRKVLVITRFARTQRSDGRDGTLRMRRDVESWCCIVVEGRVGARPAFATVAPLDPVYVGLIMRTLGPFHA